MDDAHQRSGCSGEGATYQSLGRRSEPAHADMLWGQKIENSQSDGIAANHSRKLTMQLGFEQSVAPDGGSREDSMRSEGMNETPHQKF